MALRIITLNLNGIRSAVRKGFFPWMIEQDADFICVQETRAKLLTQTDLVTHPDHYTGYFSDATKKGYSGVGIYTKLKPLKIIDGLGFDLADQEGRYLQLDFKNFSIASLYLPSGTSGEERQEQKYHFLDQYLPMLKKIAKENRPFIICGDWNIAHKEIDLKNWRANQNHTGFLPEERAWLDLVFEKIGLVDAFRVINQEPNQYTWWSNFGRAWERNVGWRIDYQVVTPILKDKIKHASIYKEQRFSDHAPLIIDYDWNLIK
jgi:exodeoxyribonuclease III